MYRTILILAVMLLGMSVYSAQWLNNALQLLQPSQPVGYNNNYQISPITGFPCYNCSQNVNQPYYQNQYPNQYVTQYPTQYQNQYQSQIPNAYQYQNPYYNRYDYPQTSTSQIPYSTANGIKNQMIRNVCQSFIYPGMNGN